MSSWLKLWATNRLPNPRSRLRVRRKTPTLARSSPRLEKVATRHQLGLRLTWLRYRIYLTGIFFLVLDYYLLLTLKAQSYT